MRSLKIGQCGAIKSFPEEIIGNNSRLESLYISDCDSLTFITRLKLPSSLKWLGIKNCKKLQHLVDGEEDASSSSSSSGMLKYLEIFDCPEFTSLSSGIQLLGAVEDLFISKCQKLESIPNGLNNLQRISIWDCPNLVSLGERGLPNTISRVSIGNCEKLEALPRDMHKLNSLQDFWIRGCPSIVSFPEGFPTNLRRLAIGRDVKMFYKGLIQWGLQRLTSLTYLSIEGCDEAESFPDEESGMMLPTTLTHLHIWELPNLKYLSSTGFQRLSTLPYLWINGCPNLSSLPEVGLPSSLLELWINKCPKLTKKCKRDKGKEWSKIANIPYVKIDGRFIDDPGSEEE